MAHFRVSLDGTSLLSDDLPKRTLVLPASDRESLEKTTEEKQVSIEITTKPEFNKTFSE